MRISKEIENNTVTIRLEGRLDTNTSPDLEKELKELNEIKNLVLDFKDLEYISSAGLRIILMLKKEMDSKGSFIIKNVNENIKNVFEITGFLDILNIV